MTNSGSELRVKKKTKKKTREVIVSEGWRERASEGVEMESGTNRYWVRGVGKERERETEMSRLNS